MKKTLKWIDMHFEECFFVFFLAVMVVMNFLNVVCRYLLPQTPFSYTEQLTGVLFVWITMLGIAYCYKKGCHTCFDLLVKKVPKRLNICFSIFWLVGNTALAVVIAYSGILITKQQITFGNELTSLRISSGWLSAAMPVGGFLMIYRILQFFFLQITGKDAVDHVD